MGNEKCHINELYNVYYHMVGDGFEPREAFKTVIEEGILKGFECENCTCNPSDAE